jgi:hypothetical protein
MGCEISIDSCINSDYYKRLSAMEFDDMMSENDYKSKRERSVDLAY